MVVAARKVSLQGETMADSVTQNGAAVFRARTWAVFGYRR